MEKSFIEFFNLIGVLAIALFPFLKTKGRGFITLGVITVQVIISSFVAFSVFTNGVVLFTYPGSFVTGQIPVRIDYLSAWFMLILNFTFLTGAWYGLHYMKKYKDQTDNLALHATAFILLYTSII